MPAVTWFSGVVLERLLAMAGELEVLPGYHRRGQLDRGEARQWDMREEWLGGGGGAHREPQQHVLGRTMKGTPLVRALGSVLLG